MVELRINTKTNVTSWGFTDGNLFYPFGSDHMAKAMATLLLMKYKSTGEIEADMTGEPDSEWKPV